MLRTCSLAFIACIQIACLLAPAAYSEKESSASPARKTVFLPDGCTEAKESEEGSYSSSNLNYGPVFSGQHIVISPEKMQRVLAAKLHPGDIIDQAHFWNCTFLPGALSALPLKNLTYLTIVRSIVPENWSVELKPALRLHRLEISTHGTTGKHVVDFKTADGVEIKTDNWMGMGSITTNKANRHAKLDSSRPPAFADESR